MTFARAAALTGLVALAPGWAAAQCYTAADLARGIEVEFEGGDVTSHRRLGDGSIEVIERFADGSDPIEFRANRGVYFTSEWSIDPSGAPIPDSRLDIEFPVDPARLPEPVPGASWTGRTVNAFEDGTRREETTSVEFAEAPPTTLSGCDYETVEARIRYDWGDEGGLSLVYDYLPALGTAILRSNQFDGDTLNETAPVAIAPMTK
ncbi:hypothetical protein [Wenxinia saemankumensis]|uniref:Uncharacterized protein n=1 Tax=Wenxinia saemankumensis TaxID=1447782 RepID=A0A1M6D1I7_9RHOB|nr:hypothetical protein [Wenxinia saemankumensis]SHI67100.1 hypothetical protein SAMN05444417_1474 [Wenxinia saemankumensis]